MRDPGSEVGNYPVNYLITPLKFPGNVRRPLFFLAGFQNRRTSPLDDYY